MPSLPTVLYEVTCVLSNKLKLRCPLSFERAWSSDKTQ